ncbi:MAG TPA: FAD-dependent oxidoreductase [Caldimonas sp.]|nr:FAD-dependent oxidoreductase [Caldimonas sp.]
MRVAVVGAGIVGVTTAWELASSGHEVTVYERHGSVAEETSFANAGMVAPGYVTPWAAPGMPGKVLRQLGSPHAAVRLHANLDLGWALRFWRACRKRTYQANRLHMQRLATYSRERLHLLTDALRLDYECRQGFLVLLRTKKELAQATPGLESLTALGTRFEVVDEARCRTIEPGLCEATPLHAAIHLPDEDVGNCRQFALLLRRHATRHGVRFRFATEVTRLRVGATPSVESRPVPTERPPLISRPAVRETSLTANPEEFALTRPEPSGPAQESFDAVVVCAALGAPALLRPLGVHLPLQPVYGYSITAPLRPEEQSLVEGPRAALMDERYKVAITRLGSRVRVAGSAELGGRPDRHHPQAISTLYRVLADWFPGAALLGQAQHWKGARPMLPDGPPVLGASGIEGVWLNLGHGSSGWALACGSARVVADAIDGRRPEIDTDGLGIGRLRR